ncbi:uncharacterized protein LOC144118466 [Amblyomma americanum]
MAVHTGRAQRRHLSEIKSSSTQGLEDGRKLSRSYSLQNLVRPSFQLHGDRSLPTRQRGDQGGTASYHCIGLMMPVYLAPLIYYGTRESLCLYSVLLPLCWWMTSSVPRCVAAFAPVFTLPVLQIMSPDETAAYFFEWESLEVTAFLALVTASHTSGSLLRRSIFRFCSKHGLEIHALYFYLACLAYVLAVFVHKSLVAVLFVLTVDKLLGFVHECELDKSLIGERSDQ